VFKRRKSAILGKLKEIKELTGIRHEAKVRKGKNSDGFVKRNFMPLCGILYPTNLLEV